MAKEFQKQISEKGCIIENFVAAPDTNNVFVWYFIVFGLGDHPWKGGYYMGKLIFPNDYPWKPPAIMMVTPSGRFNVNEKICLSISDYHPESWNPVWPVRSIIIGLISFFVTNQDTVGSLKQVPVSQQAQIAAESKDKIVTHKIYKELFKEYENFIGIGCKSKIETKPEEIKGEPGTALEMQRSPK